ncbi:MAG TPA: adenylate/guanylate cyclase domain-containing protein, partial [Stellaceae bacterium]|nr:adenylate/guanylate cyclase domain-containing protein [Stellaceae bacterium]
NLAAKLEKHNKEAGTRALTTAETWRRAVAQGCAPEPQRAIRLRCAVAGLSEPVDLAVLA